MPSVHGDVGPMPSSRTPAAVGPEPPVSIGALQFPSFPVQEPFHYQLPQSPSSICSQPVVEDEYLLPEVRLHIAFEVVSQLDKAEDARWLSPKELSFCDFLVEQISSL
jgi:hypothetical protein